MATPKEPFDLRAAGRVLVVGDIMLDRYTWGHADRVSPEAPVLVMRAESCEVRLGGAGAVAALLRGLDADVLLAGVIGHDHEGATVRRLLDEAGIDGRMLLTDPARPTTLKERFLAHVEQRQPHQILRVDHEQTQALAPDLADQLAAAVERQLLCAGLRPRTASDRRSPEPGRPSVGGSGEVRRPAPNERRPSVGHFGGVGRPAPNADSAEVAGSGEVRRPAPGSAEREVAAGSAGFSRLGPPEGGTTSAGVNEVQFAYNDFGQITHDYQAHGGTVNTSTTPKVQFGYASGSANTIRPTTITYPNGRVITYGHGVTDSMSDALSRMAAIIDDDAGSTHLADYSCLGAGLTHGRMPTLSLPLPLGEGRGEGVLSPSPLAAVGRGEGAFVEVDYTEPDIEYTLVGTAGGNDPDTGDIYRGLDRFGRVKDCYWYNYGTSTDVDRIKYGYDRNGNRIWRENVVARSYGKYFDEEYLYDLVDRLKTMDRGELDDLKSQIGNLQFAQRWGLDATGNWRSFLEDSDGDASWNLDQTRTSNKVNEIADINESAGPSWATPAYNRAGNMTTIPKPADPTQSFTATYDAWNRLVKLEDTSGTVAQYEYDGAKRRTVKKTYAAGQLNETRRFYYTEPGRWQVVEERVGTSTNPDRQFVWGPRYIDDLILRDRDTDADGTLDERLYGIQDANWNVTSVAATSGSVEERYAYHAYGTPIIFTAAFAPRGSSDFDWETGFAGYRRDDAVMLFQVRNRVYANGVGTWLQRDPLRLTGDSNLYLYVGGKPIAASDPAGAYVIIIGGIIVGIIIGGIIYWLLNKCLPANVTTPVVPPPIPWPVAPSTEVAAEAAHLFQELWEQKMHSITLVCKALDIIIKTPTHTPAEKRKQEAANFLYGIYCGGPGNVA